MTETAEAPYTELADPWAKAQSQTPGQPSEEEDEFNYAALMNALGDLAQGAGTMAMGGQRQAPSRGGAPIGMGNMNIQQIQR